MSQEIRTETTIRNPFITQPGLDEHMAELGCRDSSPTRLLGEVSVGGHVFGEHRKTIGDHWLASLDPDTNLHEVFFLMGISESEADRAKRVFALLDEATDRAIGYGDATIGGFMESDAPNLYGQLFDQE